jgi:uncharacterized membrane protein
MNKLGLSCAKLMLRLASKLGVLGLKWASCYLNFVNHIWYVLWVASWVIRSCIPIISFLGSFSGTSPGAVGRAGAGYFKIKATSASRWAWAWAELGNYTISWNKGFINISNIMNTKTMPFDIYFRTFYVWVLWEGTMYLLIFMFMRDCDTKYVFQSRHLS